MSCDDLPNSYELFNEIERRRTVNYILAYGPLVGKFIEEAIDKLFVEEQK